MCASGLLDFGLWSDLTLCSSSSSFVKYLRKALQKLIDDVRRSRMVVVCTGFLYLYLSLCLCLSIYLVYLSVSLSIVHLHILSLFPSLSVCLSFCICLSLSLWLSLP